jgi:photosystem II stability/assembly factor-like uncharacterized protein
MMPAMPRIAAFVAVLGLVACSHGTPSATPSPSPSVHGTTAAPTKRPTPPAPPVTSSPSAPPTPKPKPTKSGLPQATGPAPAHFSPIDFSFIGASFGWSLGQTCGDTTCTAHLARTTDAGHSWHALPDPGMSTSEDAQPAVKAIRFGNQEHGWLYGPGLWSTHDGGRSWKRLKLGGGDVVALEELDKTAWAVVQLCTGSGACGLSFWAAPMGSDTFVRRSYIPAAEDVRMEWQLVRAGSSSGWLSGWGNGGSKLLRTTDGGKTWAVIANPCAGTGNASYEQRLTRYDNQHLWVVCGSDAASGSQKKVLFRTSDAGTHWGNRNDGPFRGILADLFALGATQTALMATSHSGLLRTTDGGVTWKVVADDCCDYGFGKIESIDFTHVWAIGFGANAIFYSADRGRTWGKFAFHA